MKKELSSGSVLGFRVSADLMERLDLLARQDHRTRSQMARLLMEEAVRVKEKAQVEESERDYQRWQAQMATGQN